MTQEGERKLLEEMVEMKKMLAVLIEEMRNMKSIFSQYDQAYNEEVLKDGYTPR